MLCHIAVELRRLRRPKRRKRNTGEAFIRESTIALDKPDGAMAGARATKTSHFVFKVGWIERAANA